MRLRQRAAALTLLLVACATGAGPAWGATRAGTDTPAALLEQLDSGQSATITLLGDSTGDAADEWFYALSVWLADRHPEHRTTYRLWSKSDEAYAETAAVLGDGAPSGPALTIYNASVPSTKVEYVSQHPEITARAGAFSSSGPWPARTGGR